MELEEKKTMKDIPNEVLRMFFKHLETSQAYNIQRVCKMWWYLVLTVPIKPSAIDTVRVLYKEKSDMTNFVQELVDDNKKEVNRLENESKALVKSNCNYSSSLLNLRHELQDLRATNRKLLEAIRSPDRGLVPDNYNSNTFYQEGIPF